MTTPNTESMPEGRKLKSALFSRPIANGTLVSAAVGDKGIVEIVPAVVGPGGDWIATDKGQRSDGLGIRQKMFMNGKTHIQRRFVSWSNVDELSYSE